MDWALPCPNTHVIPGSSRVPTTPHNYPRLAGSQDYKTLRTSSPYREILVLLVLEELEGEGEEG